MTPGDKIFMVSESAAPGRLLVKLEAPDAEFTVEGVDISVEPLFMGATGTELDSWMEGEGEDLEEARGSKRSQRDKRSRKSRKSRRGRRGRSIRSIRSIPNWRTRHAVSLPRSRPLTVFPFPFNVQH